MLKNFFTAIVFTFLSSLPLHAADATVMMFWAQWCSACHILDPTLEKAVASYDGDVDLIRIDFTQMDLASLSREAEKAEAIGAADYVPLTNVKTGYALIIVEEEVKGKIGAGMSEDLIHMALNAALSN